MDLYLLHLGNVFLISTSLVDCTINRGGQLSDQSFATFCLLFAFKSCVGGRDIKTTETKITKIHLDGHLMNNVTKRKVPFLTQYRFNEKLSDIFRRIFVNFTLDDNWIRLLSEKFNIGWAALNIMRKIFHTLTIKPPNKADCCVKKFSTFELWEFKVKSRLNFSTEIVFWPIPSTKYFEQGRLVERANNLTFNNIKNHQNTIDMSSQCRK